MGKWGARAAFAVAVMAVLGAACHASQREQSEPQRRPSAPDPALVAGSKELLARELPGLSLGLSLQEVLRVRASIRRHAGGDREGLKLFHEALDGDSSALYLFASEAAGIGALRRVQVASHVKGPEAVVARLQDRQARLGPPTGVWDCPARAGQLPSRRYSYRRGSASALEVYVMVREQTAITYYVAATGDIRASLKEADCVPTPPERAARFPVAVP
jgi:hypothetical protein